MRRYRGYDFDDFKHAFKFFFKVGCFIVLF